MKRNNKEFFDIISTSLFCFAIKSIKEIINSQNQYILFASREGIYLKKIFETILEFLPNSYKKNFPPSSIFYVSRISTVSSVYKGRDNINPLVEATKFRFGKFSINLFMKTFNINKKELSNEACNLLNNNLEVDTNEFFRDLLKNSIWGFEVDKILENRKKILFEYIVQEIGVNKNISIVDVGWNGTIASNISSLLWENKYHFDLSEHYFGATSKSLYRKDKNTEYGIMKLSNTFLKFIKSNKSTDILSTSYMSFVETMLTSTKVGTCLGYIKVKERVEPILDNNNILKSAKLDIWQKNLINNLHKTYGKFVNSSESLEEFEKRTRNKLLRKFLNPSPKDIPDWAIDPLFDMGWGNKSKVSIVNWKNIFNKKLPRQSYWFQGSLIHAKLYKLSYLYNFLLVFYAQNSYIFKKIKKFFCK